MAHASPSRLERRLFFSFRGASASGGPVLAFVAR
jgi:hypothetical protein